MFKILFPKTWRMIVELIAENKRLRVAVQEAMEFINNSNVNTDQDYWEIWEILKAVLEEVEDEHTS